ncbi:UNVERIFIED_ORG: hypothetical protein GGI63_004643 [Rhizobium esperanzae]
MREGEEIFWRNAAITLGQMSISGHDLRHGAAVNVVRWCLNVRGRPTHHRMAFLERESPALLVYLESLAASENDEGWRTLKERIDRCAEGLRRTEMHPCARPRLTAILHTLPELAALGQNILDAMAQDVAPAADAAPVVSETGGTRGDGDKGSAGKAGSAGTTAKPRPIPRLSLPVVAVEPTAAERKVLDLVGDKDKVEEMESDAAPDSPDGTKDTTRPNRPGGVGGPK